MGKKYIADAFVKNGATADDILVGDGSTTSKAALGGGGASERDFVATGAIGAGAVVGLRSDGTVEIIEVSPTTGAIQAVPNTPKYFFKYEYDPFNASRVCASYSDTTLNRTVIVAGTISGTTITWGSVIDIAPGLKPVQICWSNTIENELLFTFGYNSLNIINTSIIGTVITLGSAYYSLSEAANEYPQDLISSPSVSNQYLALYASGSSSLTDSSMCIITTNGLSVPAIGALYETTGKRSCSIAFDLVDNSKFFELQSPTTSSTAIAHLEITGTTISLITSWTIEYSKQAGYGKIKYNPAISNSIVIIARNSIKTWLKAFTLSGSTLTQGSRMDLSGSTDSYQDKVNIEFYNDGVNMLYSRVLYSSYYNEVRKLSLGGTTLTLGDYVYTTEYTTGAPNNYGGGGVKINPLNNAEFSLFGRGNTGNLSGNVVIRTGLSNVESTIGINTTSKADTETATVKILSGISGGHSMLVIGDICYVNYQGAITQTLPVGVPGYKRLGIAVSATEILLDLEEGQGAAPVTITQSQISDLSIGRPQLATPLKGEVALGNVSGVVNIDCSLGIHFSLNMTAATSLTFSNYDTEQFKNITLHVTGNFTLTQPVSVQGDWTDINGTGTNQIFVYLFDVATPEFSSSLLPWS